MELSYCSLASHHQVVIISIALFGTVLLSFNVQSVNGLPLAELNDVWQEIYKKRGGDSEDGRLTKPLEICHENEPCGYYKFDRGSPLQNTWIPSWCKCNDGQECLMSGPEQGQSNMHRYVCGG